MAKMTSKGTRLQKSIASTFTTIAYVRSTNGPGPETQFFDGTDLNSEHLEDGEPTGQSAPGEVSGDGAGCGRAGGREECVREHLSHRRLDSTTAKHLAADPTLE